MARLDEWLSVSGQTMAPEMAYLQRMIGDIQGAVVVELGTCQGRSACALALACEVVQGHVWTIDDFDPETGGGYVTPDLEETKKNIARLRLGDFITVLVGDSTQLGIDWQGPPPDLWFHDASHFYNDVILDISAWKDHIKPGGYMAFHDYTGETLGQIGVSKAADESLGKPIYVSSRLGVFQL